MGMKVGRDAMGTGSREYKQEDINQSAALDWTIGLRIRIDPLTPCPGPGCHGCKAIPFFL